MKFNQVMSGDKWKKRRDLSDSIPQVMYDIGVGHYLMRDTGMTVPEIGEAIWESLHGLADGGGAVAYLSFGDNRFKIFLLRRGKAVDVGTREDMEDWLGPAVGVLLDSIPESGNGTP